MSLLPEVLRERATAEPDRCAYVFLDENGEETARLTYGELHTRALAVAARLAEDHAPGARALLVFPQCLDFIVAYFGCLYAQVVAVPVNPPRRNRIQEATGHIVADCEPAAVLTISAVKSTIDGLQRIDVDTLPDAPFEPKGLTADSLAFLQYTSGSTSVPKGVMVSHGNLVANQEMIKHGFGHDEHSTVVGWAPFFHDQGLIGNVLQPLYVGATAILMSPAAFIRRPLLWLTTISRYHAHTSGGPNFAFDACVAHAARGKVPELDLSSWRIAFNGAEPIRPETLRRFAETFAPHGFREDAMYPCYGLAEATLIVTGSRKGRGPRTLGVDREALGRRRLVPGDHLLAGSGSVLPGEDVRIMDPDTRRPCEPGAVGEIWVAGGNVAQGYWKRPGHENFAEGSWLRTGDLGVFDGDELYVVGRLKDLIIVRGRNHHPQDIERTAESAHPALRSGACAAFTADEKLVVIAEIHREHRHDADLDEVRGAIRAAVLAEHELSLGDLVLAKHGEVPKTSSGKIRRATARELYLAGAVERNT